MKVSGWGRYPVVETNIFAPRTEDALRELIAEHPSLIARGNGRAYGDSAVSSLTTVQTRHLNKMISFDQTTGQLVAEAGVLLGDVIDAFLPRGWFPIVTPGTKFVTLGGAIAADVHGKNHHVDGSFRCCVDWIDIMGADGRVQRCSPIENVELFECSLGGMGLTGFILRAAIRLRPVDSGWIRQSAQVAPNLEAAIEVFDHTQQATYSVAWIDCLGAGDKLGRSIVMSGTHATVSDLAPRHLSNRYPMAKKGRLSVPFNCPTAALNKYSVRAFNALYYWAGQRKAGGTSLVDYDRFFYPLDSILGWNKIYGRKGFVQFQCVLPLNSSRDGLTALLTEISKHGLGSFLAVLKRLGPQNSRFSFPQEGYTLALDFPVNEKTLKLQDTLYDIAAGFGGRFYLAKDSCMSAEVLRRSDGRVDSFVTSRREQGWSERFHSAQSERLCL
ncbi:FAD-binding protein [Ruegeria sp.]|uniref:FAD-binding oxidoreductase n=1 Tax=Ruegeria sp. TaxID=1879320 RepID=UPI003B595558